MKPRRPKICYCMCIYKDELRETIERESLRTVEQVQQSTGAGTGCTDCLDWIQNLIAAVEAEAKPAACPQRQAQAG